MTDDHGAGHTPLQGHEPAGDPCHDIYQEPESAMGAERSERPGGYREVRIIRVAGSEDSSVHAFTESLRDPHVSPPVIVDLTGANLDSAGEAALMVACVEASERHQRLVVVAGDSAERAALYDLGMTSILPIARSEAEARQWLDGDPEHVSTV